MSIDVSPPRSIDASRWIRRFAGLVPEGAPVLDLACGSGRHARLFLDRGHPVTAVDADTSGLADLAGHPRLEVIRADLEDGSPWPPGGRRFGGVVVTDYLWRPLLPRIVAAVGDRGVLLYETFAGGNEALGRPARPAFLLRAGELIEGLRGELQVVAYEHGRDEHPRPAIRQRIAAVRDARPKPLR